MFIFDWAYKLLRWGIGGVFIYAGIMKLLHPLTFATLIDAYGIIPESLLLLVSIALPILEVAAGAGLLLDMEGSLPAIAGLTALFIIILGYGVWMGLDIDCGCFGPSDPEGDAFHGLRTTLCRDLFLLGGIGFLFGWRRYRGITPLKLTLIIKNLNRERGTEHAYD